MTGYAINADETGWRIVSDESAILDGETYSETNPGTTLAMAVSIQTGDLNRSCAAAIKAGFSSSVTGTSYDYSFGSDDVTNLKVAYDMAVLAQSIAGTWEASTAYATDDVILIDSTYLICTTSGTSGTSAPTVPSEFNTVASDGDAAWKICGYLVNTSSGYVWHSVQNVVALWRLYASFQNTCHYKLQTYLDGVASATTASEVEAIVWED